MKKSRKVFLVGIDGIGVSAVAKYLHRQGYEIFGSDLHLEGENVQELQKNYGLQFFHEDNVSAWNDYDFDFLIYTAAIDTKTNSQLQQAQLKGIPIHTYAEYLGQISEDKFTISVAGTNGKTTTTTMLTETLDHLGLKPNAIAGGIMKKFGSNYLGNESNLLILESCEYKNSFLNLHPDIAIITNITPDHLDFFGDFDKEKQAFVSFIDNIKEGGVLVCNISNKNLVEVVQRAEKRNLKIIDYTQFLKNLELNISGEYNRENAAAVLGVISHLHSDKLNLAKKYLETEFTGSARRLELVGQTSNGVDVYDDYAHNPEAIELLISGLRKRYSEKKLVVVFQPHLYSRTKDFQEEFERVLSLADELYLPPIYSAREKFEDFNVTSGMLAEKVTCSVQVCDSLDECAKTIRDKNYDKDTIIITVGAGDVYQIAKKLVS